jgi:chromosomal replication initiation ATPase DnaA
MSNDIKHQLTSQYHSIIYILIEFELQDLVLTKIEELLARNGGNIKKYSLPQITMTPKITTNNHFIEEELNYDIMTLEYEANISYNQLNTDQKEAFHKVIDNVLRHEPNLFFISRHGGTGKTFLYNTIISYLRARKEIVLIVASSGVASLLLPNGCTTHSRFHIPIEIDELSICDVKRGTKLADLFH